MKNIIQLLTSLSITNPWILIIVYYIIKQIIKAFISLLMDQKEDIPSHIYEMGPDLCFMGFTLFAAAMTSNSPKLSTFANQSLAIFFYTIFLVGLYAFSYASLQGFKRLGKLQGTSIKILSNVSIQGKWLFGLRILFLVFSILCGATAFGNIIELVKV